MLELLVGGRRWDEQAVSVSCASRSVMGGLRNGDGLTCCHTADDAGACDGSVHDRDDICELCLECRVKVCRGVHGCEAVAICEFGEHANIAAVFELDAFWTLSDGS